MLCPNSRQSLPPFFLAKTKPTTPFFSGQPTLSPSGQPNTVTSHRRRPGTPPDHLLRFLFSSGQEDRITRSFTDDGYFTVDLFTTCTVFTVMESDEEFLANGQIKESSGELVTSDPTVTEHYHHILLSQACSSSKQAGDDNGAARPPQPPLMSSASSSASISLQVV